MQTCQSPFLNDEKMYKDGKVKYRKGINQFADMVGKRGLFKIVKINSSRRSISFRNI